MDEDTRKSSLTVNDPAASANGARPLSAGRAKSLRRRFTTPHADLSGSHGSLSSLHHTAPFAHRESVDTIITDITVGPADALDDIQALIIHLSDHLKVLRLRYCNQLQSSHLHDILGCITPKLLSFEIRESEGHNEFDLTHLEHLVTKCKHLRALHFEDCFSIDHRCLRFIGSNLLELQNIAFIHTKRKLWPDNPIHELVTHIPLELHSVKFAGFDDIFDFHVNYAVDCYQSSLNAISLGDCPQITDRCVEYIATNCKLLRHLELFKTNISDSTLWFLAKHCNGLHYIDLSNCPKITDYGVKELVTHTGHLRYINLGWNPKVKDLAFQSIVRHCSSIVRIKLDGTSITRVPASIIKRKPTLKEVSLSMCKELTMGTPNDEHQNSGPTLPGIYDHFENRNLNHRLKVFFLGSVGTGKTALIKALLGKGVSEHMEPNTDGVNVYSWQPLKESTWDGLVMKDISEEERSMHLNLWDCDGREILRGVHPVFFTDAAVYVCMCNFEDSSSVEKIPELIHTIHARARRPQIFIVATRADKYADEDCQARLDLIKRSIDSAELIRKNSINVELALLQELPDKTIFETQMFDLQRQSDEKYVVKKYIPLSASGGKGVEVFRKSLLNLCLDGTTFPHTIRPIPPGWVEFHDEILQMKQNNCVCISWHDFEVLAAKDERVSKPRFAECVGFLQQAGVILDLRVHQTIQTTDLICINPAILGRAACALHIDDQKKSFRFEAKRFWPRTQDVRPPDAQILASALEEIPNKGIIKESLLPLIWQDIAVEEEQILRIRALLLNLSLLASSKASKPASETLLLPNYPKLLPQIQYVIPVLNLLPDSKPQLNWTSRPFRGDVQISLYLYFLPLMPPGVAHRLVALVNNTLIDKCSYQYYWKHGVLTRNADMLLLVSCEQNEYLEISARVTAEDEQDLSLVEFLWLGVFYVLDVVLDFMETNWSSVRTTVSLIAYGDIFYQEEKIDTEPELTLSKIFHAAKLKDDIQFKDGQEDKFIEITKLIPAAFMPTSSQDYDSWLQWIFSKRDKLFESSRLNAPTDNASSSSHDSSPSQSRPKKKKISINWSVPEGEKHDYFSSNGQPDSHVASSQPNGHIPASKTNAAKQETLPASPKITPVKPPTPPKTTLQSQPENSPPSSATKVTKIDHVDSPRTNIQTSNKQSEEEPASAPAPESPAKPTRKTSQPRTPPTEARKPTPPRRSNESPKPNGSESRTRSRTCTLL